MTLHGQCHCKAIAYELDWPDETGSIPARRCGCTYCTRFGGTWTSHPGARLNIVCKRESGPGRYQFGTKTADFLFCEQCGVSVAALCEVDGITKAVVNIATLKNTGNLEFDHSDSDFDGESVERRLERRMERWIANVSLRSIR